MPLIDFVYLSSFLINLHLTTVFFAVNSKIYEPNEKKLQFYRISIHLH